MRNKFNLKVGDKVKVREWDEMEKKFGVDGSGDLRAYVYFIKSMREFCGKVFVIEAVNGISVRLKGCGDYAFSFDTIVPITQKIVITTDGVETLARLYEGDKVVKAATAKCCIDDTFDFGVGAKLAFSRLIGGKEEENKFVPHLICGGSHYGNIGEATNFLDAIGRQLCVGDVVEVYNEDLESCGNSVIAKENNEEFVTGIYSSSRGGKIKNGWQIIKARAYTDVEHNAMIDCIKYKKEAE